MSSLFIFNRITISWPYQLNGSRFIFLLRAVKTIHRTRIYKSSRKEVSNVRFLARNTNKALCSAATLAVLDTLGAITSWSRRPKLRDLTEAGWRKQRKFEMRIRERNHAFGNESIRVRRPFIISSCTAYISWLFRMSAKCVRNLSQTIGRVSTKRQKEHCNSFSLGKGDKARRFLNLPQMRTKK